MVQPISSREGVAAPPSGVTVAIITAASVFAVAAVIGAAALWAHYGTAVFFEMIKSGIAACI
jgi:hypothetical protein